MVVSNTTASIDTLVTASDNVPVVSSSASNSQSKSPAVSSQESSFTPSNMLSAPMATSPGILNTPESVFATGSVVDAPAASTVTNSASNLVLTSYVGGIAPKVSSAITGLVSASISPSAISSAFVTVSSNASTAVTSAASSPSPSSSGVVTKSTPLVTNPTSSSALFVSHSSTPLSSAAPVLAQGKPSSVISSTSSLFVSTAGSTKVPSISSTTIVSTQDDQTHASKTIIVTTSASKISASVTSNAVLPQVSQPSSLESISSLPSSAKSQSTQAIASASFAIQGSSSSRASLESAEQLKTGIPKSDGSSNLGVSLTEPALATSSVRADATFITSVSSDLNGVVPQTFTSNFANPTSIAGTESLDHWTFWDNRGAIAGVFIAVVLAILASMLGIFYCCRRRRLRSSHGIFTNKDRFPQDMLEQPTTYQAVVNDPQRPLMAPSIMSGGTSVGHNGAVIQHSNSLHSGDIHTGALGLSGMPVNPRQVEHIYEGPYSDYHRYIPLSGDNRSLMPRKLPVEIAFSSYLMPDSRTENIDTSTAVGRPPSPAPSSPSIYPPSLYAVEKDVDDYIFYEREIQRRPLPQLPIPPPKAFVDDANPQNPFSSAFDSKVVATAEHEVFLPQIQTGQVYQPLTPPDSSLGHSSLPSPVSPQSSEAEAVKPPNPFSNSFLGRPVSVKIEPLPRPKRSLLRLSASGSSLKY